MRLYFSWFCCCLLLLFVEIVRLHKHPVRSLFEGWGVVVVVVVANVQTTRLCTSPCGTFSEILHVQYYRPQQKTVLSSQDPYYYCSAHGGLLCVLHTRKMRK